MGAYDALVILNPTRSLLIVCLSLLSSFTFLASVVCFFFFLPPACLCIQRRVFWENNGREKLVIYHYTVMGALLPLKEVNLS